MLKTQYLLQMASTNANGPRTYCIISTLRDSLGRVILGQLSAKLGIFCNFQQLECHPEDFAQL